ARLGRRAELPRPSREWESALRSRPPSRSGGLVLIGPPPYWATACLRDRAWGVAGSRWPCALDRFGLDAALRAESGPVLSSRGPAGIVRGGAAPAHVGGGDELRYDVSQSSLLARMAVTSSSSSRPIRLPTMPRTPPARNVHASESAFLEAFRTPS